ARKNHRTDRRNNRPLLRRLKGGFAALPSAAIWSRLPPADRPKVGGGGLAGKWQILHVRMSVGKEPGVVFRFLGEKARAEKHMALSQDWGASRDPDRWAAAGTV